MALETSEILAGLAEIVAEETGLPADTVTPEKSFVDDLDIDSLSMMTIMTLAEEKFEVRIPDEAATKMSTVQEAADFIASAEQA